MPRDDPQAVPSTDPDPEPIEPTADGWLERFRELRSSWGRARTGRFGIEGTRFLQRALDAGMKFDVVLVADAMLRGEAGARVVEELRRRSVPVVPITRRDFHRLTWSRRPSGLAAIVRQRWTRLADVRPGPVPWLALERVRSAGNLGSLLRTREAVGCPGLVVTGSRIDPFDPGTVRATMGSHFEATYVRTSTAALRRWADEHDGFLIGACASGEVAHDELRYPPGTVLVLGDERKGLTDEARAACDLLVRIPMAGRLDSLNLAVAGSLLLYESFRQRRALTRSQ